MTEKLSAFKEGFSELARLCYEVDSVTLSNAIRSIESEVDELEDDYDMEQALSLLTEVLIHVNDLDTEESEEYEDIIRDINDMAEDLRNDANCT